MSVRSRLPRNAPAWLDRLSEWLEPFEVCFTHVAQRGAFRRYLLGLLSDSRRKSMSAMLERVSLTENEANRRVGNYSLGMRQRLGLATALIGDPTVLILDEPANGLDPAGIRWMRGLLRDFADRGGTVLLSSHLLHEIEVIADDLVVIGNGRIVAQGAKSDLLASAGSVVRTTEPHVLAAALAARGITSSHVGTDGLLAQADADQVGRTAFGAGVPVSSTSIRPAPLPSAAAASSLARVRSTTSRVDAAAPPRTARSATISAVASVGVSRRGRAR